MAFRTPSKPSPLQAAMAGFLSGVGQGIPMGIKQAREDEKASQAQRLADQKRRKEMLETANKFGMEHFDLVYADDPLYVEVRSSINVDKLPSVVEKAEAQAKAEAEAFQTKLEAQQTRTERESKAQAEQAQFERATQRKLDVLSDSLERSGLKAPEQTLEEAVQAVNDPKLTAHYNELKYKDDYTVFSEEMTTIDIEQPDGSTIKKRIPVSQLEDAGIQTELDDPNQVADRRLLKSREELAQKLGMSAPEMNFAQKLQLVLQQPPVSDIQKDRLLNISKRFTEMSSPSIAQLDFLSKELDDITTMKAPIEEEMVNISVEQPDGSTIKKRIPVSQLEGAGIQTKQAPEEKMTTIKVEQPDGSVVTQRVPISQLEDAGIQTKQAPEEEEPEKEPYVYRNKATGEETVRWFPDGEEAPNELVDAPGYTLFRKFSTTGIGDQGMVRQWMSAYNELNSKVIKTGKADAYQLLTDTEKDEMLWYHQKLEDAGQLPKGSTERKRQEMGIPAQSGFQWVE